MVKKLLVIVSLVFHDMTLYKKKREKEKERKLTLKPPRILIETFQS